MRFLLLLIISLVLPAPAALACQTPVYRYAMYRWQPRPYEVYCFYHGNLTSQDRETQQAIQKAATGRSAVTNVALTELDVAADPELVQAAIPDMVRQIYRTGDRPEGSSYLIMSPIGLPVYHGPLSPEEAPKMLTSPLRRRIAAELGKGVAGVFLLVKGKDTPAYDEPPEPGARPPVTNAIARKRLNQLAADVQSGDLLPPTEPPPGARRQALKAAGAGSFDPLPGVDTADNPQDQAPHLNGAKLQTGPLQIAVIELSRDDPQEQWLLRMLMAVEPDLHEFDEPMVFAFLGRGRVLPPYIGQGIHPRLLETQFKFMTGPCSCTVADENPGVDILMTQDWDAAAKKMAEQFEGEEGSEAAGGEDFFPELLTGGENSIHEDTGFPEMALQATPENGGATTHSLKPAATTLTHGTPPAAAANSVELSWTPKKRLADPYETTYTFTTDYSWLYLLGISLGVLLLAGIVAMSVATFATRKSQQ